MSNKRVIIRPQEYRNTYPDHQSSTRNLVSTYSNETSAADNRSCGSTQQLTGMKLNRHESKMKLLMENHRLRATFSDARSRQYDSSKSL